MPVQWGDEALLAELRSKNPEELTGQERAKLRTLVREEQRGQYQAEQAEAAANKPIEDLLPRRGF